MENGHLGFEKVPPAISLFQVKFEIVNESLTEKRVRDAVVGKITGNFQFHPYNVFQLHLFLFSF